MRAISIAAVLALAAFSACSPREQADAGATGESASANNAATSQVDTAAQPQTQAPVQMQAPAQTQWHLNRTMYVNATSGLRVKSTPGAEGEILGALEYLAEVNVIMEANNIVTIDGVEGRWVYIDRPITGWIFDGYLETEEQRRHRIAMGMGTEHGRNVAREFLRGLRIVSDPAIRIVMRDNGELAAFDAWQEVEMELPLMGRHGFAYGYTLFDLNGDGIFEIVVLWNHAMEVGAPFVSTLHVYSNGEYIDVRSMDSPRFYGCDQGYIYLQTGSWGYEGLNRVTFVDGGIRFTFVAEFDNVGWGWPIEITARGDGITRVLQEYEFDALVESSDWEHMRGDFPEFALWLDRRDSLRPILPLELDLFAWN